MDHEVIKPIWEKVEKPIEKIVLVAQPRTEIVSATVQVSQCVEVYWVEGRTGAVEYSALELRWKTCTPSRSESQSWERHSCEAEALLSFCLFPWQVQEPVEVPQIQTVELLTESFVSIFVPIARSLFFVQTMSSGFCLGPLGMTNGGIEEETHPPTELADGDGAQISCELEVVRHEPDRTGVQCRRPVGDLLPCLFDRAAPSAHATSWYLRRVSSRSCRGWASSPPHSRAAGAACGLC
eukprot:6479488-Amphidinium_carterae.2